jgi:hypothetical protein
MRGRRPKQESRAADFRRMLIAWKQTLNRYVPAILRILLSPLKAHKGLRGKPGNPAKPGEGGTHAFVRIFNAKSREKRVRRCVRRALGAVASDESRMIRRFAFLWRTGRGSKPSGRAWAKQPGISHTWVQKLVRQFQADPTEMYRDVRRCGDPTFAQLTRARECTQRLREQGELRRCWSTDPASTADGDMDGMALDGTVLAGGWYGLGRYGPYGYVPAGVAGRVKIDTRTRPPPKSMWTAATQGR